MSYTNLDGLKLFEMDSLKTSGIQHAFFSRHGGVSGEPWASLNLGGTVGDDPEHVRENRRLAFNAIHRSEENAYDVWQVHSDTILYTREPRKGREFEKADAIITDRSGVILFMRFADCVPILITDPVKGLVALVHSGWPGTVKRITQKTVETLNKKYHCNLSDLRAGIGPSICMEHYPIGEDVIQQVRTALPEFAGQVLIQKDHQTHFDLWKTNELLLRAAGVEQVEVSGICTAGNTQDWFSHRGDHGKTGRFGAVLYLE
jgi:YfiH family protein